MWHLTKNDWRCSSTDSDVPDVLGLDLEDKSLYTYSYTRFPDPKLLQQLKERIDKGEVQVSQKELASAQEAFTAQQQQ